MVYEPGERSMDMKVQRLDHHRIRETENRLAFGYGFHEVMNDYRTGIDDR
jgi:hypothetical protein